MCLLASTVPDTPQVTVIFSLLPYLNACSHESFTAPSHQGSGFQTLVYITII